MGKAANYFLLRRRQGVQAEEVTAVYRNALSEAFELAKARAIGTSARGTKP
jgi:hypothetical protein